MKRKNGRLMLVLTLGSLGLSALGLSGCGANVEAATEAANPPVVLERLEGESPTRETLTEEAAKRLDIQTGEVEDIVVDGVQRKAVPYAAIIYDTEGATWVYESTGPLTFVRQPVVVDDIQGDQAIVTEGPDSGSKVVTTGAEELFGAESEFAEE